MWLCRNSDNNAKLCAAGRKELFSAVSTNGEFGCLGCLDYICVFSWYMSVAWVRGGGNKIDLNR